jgi:hypothetical protein
VASVTVGGLSPAPLLCDTLDVAALAQDPKLGPAGPSQIKAPRWEHKVKILIQWMPNEPGLSSSTRDEDGLRELFGQAEADRILDAISQAGGEPVTLIVNGRDAGFTADWVEVRFSEVGPWSARSRR